VQMRAFRNILKRSITGMQVAQDIHVPSDHSHWDSGRQDELGVVRSAMYIVHLFQILDLSSGCIVSVVQVLRLSDLSLGKEILTLT